MLPPEEIQLIDNSQTPAAVTRPVTVTSRLTAVAVPVAVASLVMITMLTGTVILPDQALAQRRDPPSVHGTFDGDSMYTVLPPNAIAAIMEPRFVVGDEAIAQMRPDEPVLGVMIEGDARAYSLWQLDAHEIVNDTVGGVPLAATW